MAPKPVWGKHSGGTEMLTYDNQEMGVTGRGQGRDRFCKDIIPVRQSPGMRKPQGRRVLYIILTCRQICGAFSQLMLMCEVPVLVSSATSGQVVLGCIWKFGERVSRQRSSMVFTSGLALASRNDDSCESVNQTNSLLVPVAFGHGFITTTET